MQAGKDRPGAQGPTRTRTGVTGIRIPGANHYTIGPVTAGKNAHYRALSAEVLKRAWPTLAWYPYHSGYLRCLFLDSTCFFLSSPPCSHAGAHHESKTASAERATKQCRTPISASHAPLSLPLGMLRNLRLSLWPALMKTMPRLLNQEVPGWDM